MSFAVSGLAARLSALHAATFVAVAVHLSFFPVWLASRHLDAGAIGLLVAIPIVVRIVATAPLLSLADRRLGARRLLILCHAAQVVLYPALFLIEDPFAMAALIAVIAVVQAAIMPGNDLATTNVIKAGASLNYGRVRVWGSIAFLAASIATGYLIDALGPQVILWGLILTPLLGIAATAAALPPGAPVPAGPVRQAPPAAAPLPRVLFVVMAATALTQASHAAVYAFGSIHWRSIGFSDAVIGYFWAIGVVAEVGVFVWFGRTVGHGAAALWLVALGGAAAVIRFGVMALDPGLAATFALQAMHGLTFGATHLGTMSALAALAPESARGRAQGLFVAVAALATAAATIASGPLYRAFGPLAFAAMAPLGALGLFVSLWASHLLKTHART